MVLPVVMYRRDSRTVKRLKAEELMLSDNDAREDF